jgi:hypothetical protein
MRRVLIVFDTTSNRQVYSNFEQTDSIRHAESSELVENE